MTFQPLRIPSLSDEIDRRIRDYILDNQLQPGDRLPGEADLARQLQVSRSAVREAFKALEALGIIEVRKGTGRFVKKGDLGALFQNLAYSILFDGKRILELLALRQTLEIGFIDQCIARISPEQLKRMEELLQCMREKAHAGESFFQEDIAFHRVLLSAAGNDLLLELLEVFVMVYGRARGKLFTVGTDLVGEFRRHQEIYQAVQDRDVARAKELIRQHFSSIEQRVIQAVQSQGG